MSDTHNPIELLIQRHEEIHKFLIDHEEITLADNSDAEFRKVLILSIASYFEYLITEAIRDLAEKSSPTPVFELVKAKAISRQYHTYFAWNEGKNINSFTKLFGESFKQKINEEIKKRDLADGRELFLELGQRRNLLVHENFAAASVSWTVEEIKIKYEKALKFVLFLSAELRNSANNGNSLTDL